MRRPGRGPVSCPGGAGGCTDNSIRMKRGELLPKLPLRRDIKTTEVYYFHRFN